MQSFQSVCPDKEELAEMQPSYFCVYHVLRVHFPFSEKMVTTGSLFTVGLCWRCSVDHYLPFKKRRMRHLSYPSWSPGKTGENLPSFSTFGDQSVFKGHLVVDTVQSHSARNGLCTS